MISNYDLKSMVTNKFHRPKNKYRSIYRNITLFTCFYLKIIYLKWNNFNISKEIRDNINVQF